MKVRTHYSITLDARTACGVSPSAITNNRAEVTCRLCLRAIDRVEAVAIEIRDRRGDASPAVLDGPGQSEVGAEGARAIARSIAGEPVSTGARWGSVSAAMSALAETHDARRSVASSSDWASKGTGGGRTPTTPRETREDFVDLEAAFERAVGAVRVGVDTVPRDAVRAIAEARLLGRRIERKVLDRMGTDRKSTTLHRAEVTALETAELAGMTRTQVAIVVRAVRRRLAEELVRKGLVPARALVRESGQQQEAEMASAFDLESWKSIAPIVGRSEDVCKRLAQRDADPLPVSRYLGRVVAKREEIEAWIARQLEAA